MLKLDVIILIMQSCIPHVSTNKVLKVLEQRETLFKTGFEVYELSNTFNNNNNAAPYKILQGAAALSAATARNTGANPFSS